MNGFLKKQITEKNIFMNLKSKNKEDLIIEMIDNLVSLSKIVNRDAAIDAVLTREKKMSTGMQNNIAIPHGKTDSVNTLITAIGIKKQGVDFDSVDRMPAKIFIMTISPKNRTGPHIQFISEVSKLLNSPDIRDKILNAKNEKEILEVLF